MPGFVILIFLENNDLTICKQWGPRTDTPKCNVCLLGVFILKWVKHSAKVYLMTFLIFVLKFFGENKTISKFRAF